MKKFLAFLLLFVSTSMFAMENNSKPTTSQNNNKPASLQAGEKVALSALTFTPWLLFLGGPLAAPVVLAAHYAAYKYLDQNPLDRFIVTQPNAIELKQTALELKQKE